MNALLATKLQGCTVCLINTFTRSSLSTLQLKEYHSILNVNKSSTPKEIKESFLKLSKVYHPDNSVTGSHIQFVKLKEAYDALKDGTPTTSDSSTSSYSKSTNSYSNYNEHADVSYKAHAYYRNKSRDHYTNYSEGRPFGYGFGGPYSRSKTPWEDMMKDKDWERRRSYQYRGKPFNPTLIRTTLFFSAVCWIIIYSGMQLIWDYNDNIRRSMSGFSGNYEEYVAFEEALRRKEQHKLLRSRMVNNQKKKENDSENN